ELQSDDDSTLQRRSDGLAAKPLPMLHGDTVESLNADEIIIVITDTDELLTVHVPQHLLLGRNAVDPIGYPSLNLTRYGAFSKGVSRHHATLYRGKMGLVIEDVGSSNGTRLNGARLEPHKSYQLKSGDQLHLGNLAIALYFRE